MPKRPQASAFKDEPSQKKTRRGSEVVASAQVSEIIPYSTEEQEEEEEEEEEAVPALRPQGLHSRSPAVLMKVEPAGQSVVAEGAIVVESPAVEVTERAEVQIPTQPGVSTQLEVPSAQERVEVQQPGSPSILMSTSRVVGPSHTTGLLSGKAPATKASFV